MENNINKHIETLIERYPALACCKESIQQAYDILKQAYAEGRKLLVCGNGGSASDSEHIVGELMKEFKLKRDPDRYYEVEHDLKSGKIAARNLKNKQKAIFLDRDGTINVYKGFLTKPEDFELIPGVAEAIRQINHSGYLAVVVSNQPVIARGDCSFDELRTIHNKMETLLGKEKAFIDAIYYCPHHPDKGFGGERPEYKFDCDCRKPKPGLLLQAAEEWNIELAASYMIGDSDRDIEAGQAAGCKQSILIERNRRNALRNAISYWLH